MISSDLLIVGYYDYRLVTLFVLISILASYTARDLSEGTWNSRRRMCLIRLVCGVTVNEEPAVCSRPTCGLFTVAQIAQESSINSLSNTPDYREVGGRWLQR
jgi:hypothetical protein